MRKRGLCCGPVSVGRSVSLSFTFVHSVQMSEDIVKLLCRPGSPITVVFWPPAPIPNSKGNPFSGDMIQGEWRKFANFDWNRLLSWKRYEIGPYGCYGTLIGSHISRFVKVGYCSSSPCDVLSGVPQGSVLGPVLFILFVNDICNIVPSGVNLKLFADDVK